MKIHILYNFKEGAWGGGNQFLKALRKYFIEEECYAESPNDADVILFNSHHELKSVLRLKMERPQTIFIHRVDGPIFYTRGRDRETDKIIFDFNQSIADGTVFQSKWSRNKSYELGMKKNEFETVIINAPDSEIFYPSKNEQPRNDGEKLKLIAACWATNIKKGFDIYEFIDKNADFNKYEMTFVGRSPVEFRNIRHVPPQSSEKLADLLREHDIFIIASIDDPCSNSLIEALHCRLPAVVRSSGGHPEIIGTAGVTFEGKEDVLDAINLINENLEMYRGGINRPNISVVGRSYYDFCKRVYDTVQSGDYPLKKNRSLEYYHLMVKVHWWKHTSLYREVKDHIFKRSGVIQGISIEGNNVVK